MAKAILALGLAFALTACGPSQKFPMSPHASQETGLIRVAVVDLFKKADPNDPRLKYPWKIMLGITLARSGTLIGVGAVKEGFLTEKECNGALKDPAFKKGIDFIGKDMSKKSGDHIVILPACLDSTKIPKSDEGDSITPHEGEKI
jgi:hypothetical protein